MAFKAKVKQTNNYHWNQWAHSQRPSIDLLNAQTYHVQNVWTTLFRDWNQISWILSYNSQLRLSKQKCMESQKNPCTELRHFQLLLSYNKSPPTVNRYQPLSDKVVGESHPVTREEVTRTVSDVIWQELRGQNNRFTNYQNTRGRQSFQGQPICDFCNWRGHVVATCHQRMRQIKSQTANGRDPRILNYNRPHKWVPIGNGKMIHLADQQK